ncbi:MAG: hypothetical protein KGJ07_07455 [Patescibacteria group bacterium]|nr:hypothetical protein [Patescibacteria group bacterium]
MQKLIPLIYFYTVSLIGLVLLIIGIFSDIHYIVNIASGSQYPLPYGVDQRCMVPAIPFPSGYAQKQSSDQQPAYQTCLKSVEEDRAMTKRTDLEKALSYSVVGLFVFAIHFYYARRKLQ